MRKGNPCSLKKKAQRQPSSQPQQILEKTYEDRAPAIEQYILSSCTNLPLIHQLLKKGDWPGNSPPQSSSHFVRQIKQGGKGSANRTGTAMRDTHDRVRLEPALRVFVERVLCGFLDVEAFHARVGLERDDLTQRTISKRGPIQNRSYGHRRKSSSRSVRNSRSPKSGHRQPPLHTPRPDQPTVLHKPIRNLLKNNVKTVVRQRAVGAREHHVLSKSGGLSASRPVPGDPKQPARATHVRESGNNHAPV